jgi:hypothetical protein
VEEDVCVAPRAGVVLGLGVCVLAFISKLLQVGFIGARSIALVLLSLNGATPRSEVVIFLGFSSSM